MRDGSPSSASNRRKNWPTDAQPLLGVGDNEGGARFGGGGLVCGGLGGSELGGGGLGDGLGGAWLGEGGKGGGGCRAWLQMFMAPSISAKRGHSLRQSESTQAEPVWLTACVTCCASPSAASVPADSSRGAFKMPTSVFADCMQASHNGSLPAMHRPRELQTCSSGLERLAAYTSCPDQLCAPRTAQPAWHHGRMLTPDTSGMLLSLATCRMRRAQMGHAARRSWHIMSDCSHGAGVAVQVPQRQPGMAPHISQESSEQDGECRRTYAQMPGLDGAGACPNQPSGLGAGAVSCSSLQVFGVMDVL